MWERSEFAERIGLGTVRSCAHSGRPRETLIARADEDPATRGMLAVVSSATLDGQGGADAPRIRYWYRRPNGQTSLVHLFDVDTDPDPENGLIGIDEIYYRDKPLLADLPTERRTAVREILLDVVREVNLHLREGGSPKEILRILHDCNIQEIVGEEITLPGQDKNGNFHFRFADAFNAAAKGELSIEGDPALLAAVALAEMNTLDAHRDFEDGERYAFGTNRTTGVTYRADVKVNETPRTVEIAVSLQPTVIPEGERARPLDFIRTSWRKDSSFSFEQRTGSDEKLILGKMHFLGRDIGKMDTDTKIRVLGVAHRVLDLFRRRRYPTAVDFIHEFDLMDMTGSGDPPGREGRMHVTSYLGNGKAEIVEGFGQDLGACKAVTSEWEDEGGNTKRETVILDLGKMIAPHGSEWDGGLPDVIGILRDTKAIFVSHRHLDHMAAVVELTRLGLLKGITVHGSKKALYILQSQVKNELDDKTLMPDFQPLEGEGIIHYERLSVEYSVDAMDHSTPSTICRVVGRTSEETQNLKPSGVRGSYLFYGDGRRVQKREFLSRGMRSFGIARQDTLFDVDITNAKKAGHCPTEDDAEKNLIDLMNCFPQYGLLTGLISTNDRRLKTLFRVFNRVGRNFTGVGYNVEMSLRAHNIHGVDPEYEIAEERDNINRFLQRDAEEAGIERAVEFRGRGSNKAKSWLEGDLGGVAVLATGTQGNPNEMYSSMSRFAEGWSTLDLERHTSYKIRNPDEWVVIIDQSAIPGNEKYQDRMVRRLLSNRAVRGVIVAVDDGFRVHGLDEKERRAFQSKYVTEGRDCYMHDDGRTFVVTGAPIHPSGHGHRSDIGDIVEAAKADVTHGTHTNDAANTVALHDECDTRGLSHLDRQFDDFERNEIDMGASPEQAKITSTLRENSSVIVYRLVREFGKFFGGTLQARRITRQDGRHGFDEVGLSAGGTSRQYERDVVTVEFSRASRAHNARHTAREEPPPAMRTGPAAERRYKGVAMPGSVRIDDSRLQAIRDHALSLVA